MRRRLLALLVCLPLFTAALPAAAAEETNVAQGKSYTVFTEAAIETRFRIRCSRMLASLPTASPLRT